MCDIFFRFIEYNLTNLTNQNSIVSFAQQIDKGEIKLLNLIAESFLKNQDYENAIQIYRKIGNFKSLALSYIHNNQWEEALKICNDIPQMKEEIYYPYAMWLAENERFAEAQKAFQESGKFDESRQVLERLLNNSITANRFNDASYYCWLLANHGTNNDDDDKKKERDAEIYHAYQYIFKYIVCEYVIFIKIIIIGLIFLFSH